MEATSVIPQPRTADQPPFSEQLHALLVQLDGPEQLGLLTVILADLAPDQRHPDDVAFARHALRGVGRSDRAQLVESLAEFALLLIVRKAHNGTT